MDSFTIMTTFVAVGRTQSFTAAAGSRGISRALVSRHIAELEAHVGVRLVNRTTRSVSLTEAGQRHFEFCERILREIKEEEADIADLKEKPEGPLAVLSPKWIGSMDIAEAVAQFSIEYPLIKMRFELADTSRRTSDFIDHHYDIAFQTKHIRHSAVIVRKIATLKLVLCAAPSYLAKRGRPMSPKDLARHDCIAHVNEPIWRLGNHGHGAHHKIQRVAFSSNTYLVLQKAAIAGVGIALLPLRSVGGQIAAGKLETLLPDYVIPERPLYLAYAPGSQKMKRIRCFVDFMGHWFKAHPIANAWTDAEIPGVAGSPPSKLAGLTARPAKPERPCAASGVH
jgi:DNA-binding transcriptional LysR family regulator